ncbi:LL-diaminopimelate aminotransferase [Tichowtungia aerotolerans]|uniref:Aminotransferase n=1 Tax=Tichowtungia aerotolerans TaxID=2697043 RepID=A0A6P1M796_9BACT|nr:LL-diaminopimelate aminotransferase [Tichowtungia aerotolerans]QHI69727.1 LL-diaminopimelate aminotransferase [Tichowtungia aerotolerans]
MNAEKLFADRIGGEQFGKSTEIYKFEKIKRAKAKARELHPDLEILDFGVGEPDQMAPAPIREALKVQVDLPENRGYADNGIAEFKQAAAEYMKNFFGVELDPASEINHSIGTKPALAMLPLAFVNPGDVIFQTVPGYPVMATHTKYLGGEVVDIPLLEENEFLPNLESIDPALADRCKLFYINYPNNPTGAVATDEFYDELIAFAQKHNILIIQDAPYATLVYDGDRKSILQRPGAKECALELHSMSKAYNMTGWRLAFFCGAAWAVEALATVKDNCDSGQFKAIQHAACAGIADESLAEGIRVHYEKRLRKMVNVLKDVGFDAQMPGGTFYLYIKAPKGAGDVEFSNAEEASLYLIENFGISTVPWDNTGPFIRFGAVFESAGEEDDERVLNELAARLAKAELKF